MRASGIQVISRAASVLRAVRAASEGLSLGEIAERVGLPRSTVQRIVQALAHERLLQGPGTKGRVRLGPDMLAFAAHSRSDVVELAHPHLKALSEATGETVDLSLLRDDHLVFLDQVVGSHRLRAVSAVGEVFPLATTANGKASLALLADAEIAARLGRSEDRSRLMAEIAEIRCTGLAYDEEEQSPGISAIGVAIRDAGGAIYAVSVPAPTARFTAARARLEPLILATRDRLATLIGG